jgi:hypothetical protein
MEGFWLVDKCRIIEAVLLKKMIKESTDSFGEELEVLYVPQESPHISSAIKSVFPAARLLIRRFARTPFSMAVLILNLPQVLGPCILVYKTARRDKYYPGSVNFLRWAQVAASSIIRQQRPE